MFFPGETILLVFSLSLLFGAGDRHAWPLDSLELRSVDALTLSFPTGMNWDIPTENIPIHDLQKKSSLLQPNFEILHFLLQVFHKMVVLSTMSLFGK